MMKANDKEFYELMYQFEKDMKKSPIYISGNCDRAKPIDLNKRNVYNNGQVNQLFFAYMLGYANGKSIQNN